MTTHTVKAMFRHNELYNYTYSKHRSLTKFRARTDDVLRHNGERSPNPHPSDLPLALKSCEKNLKFN